MENVVKNFDLVKEEISNFKNANIVAVSKTFPIGHILPLINHGHQHFGENKVQEAQEKWTSLKNDFPNLKLHLIGKLQTNKVKFALPLFDYIHSLDSIKLAEKISLEQKKKNFKPKIFIQINLGKENQKSGIDEDDLENFYRKCVTEYNLNIIGIMCLPPFDEDPSPFFKKMQNISESLNLKEISMGMSNDYLEALKFKATYIRVGSKIFGSRT
jgi:pyridoxal phosphate enzyme (YggS family)